MPEEKTEQEIERMGALFSPEGVFLLSLAIILDFLTAVCVVLIWLFGVGLLFAKIVYIIGLIFIGGWVFIRSGFLPGKGKIRKKMLRGLTNFLKRQWKKLAVRAIPGVGDVLPGIWTWTVYSELRS